MNFDRSEGSAYGCCSIGKSPVPLDRLTKCRDPALNPDLSIVGRERPLGECHVEVERQEGELFEERVLSSDW